MKCAIVIPSHWVGKNTSWLLRECLSHIKRHEPCLIGSVVVADNASKDISETVEICQEWGVKLLKGSKDCGYAFNVNRAMWWLRERGVECVTLLNNDCFIMRPFIERSVALFTLHPRLSTIGYPLYRPDGRLNHNTYYLDANGSIKMPGYGEWSEHREEGFVMGVTGAFETLHLGRASLYDDAYDIGYEDVDHCMREWEQDKQVYFATHSHGVHVEFATRGSQLSKREMNSLRVFMGRTFDIPLIEHRLASSRLLEAEHREAQPGREDSPRG